ncbi:TraR/DksA family transcriptional regulator [Xylanimonas sp. McL0601]|uniref:TraR/DksA family transcriptional regulator n=1 Tax=Xylanimonas sp. McL0601 TaxID=3414739 RepID=UPI003CED7C05
MSDAVVDLQIAVARLRARLDAVERTIADQRAVADDISTSRDGATDDEHDPEGATLAWERAQAAGLAATSEAERAQLLAALQRVEAGTYGVCEVCGTVIPDGRLEARPFTTRCVSHAR